MAGRPFLRSMDAFARIVLLFTLALVSSTGSALSAKTPGAPAKPTPAPTPIPLAKIASEAQVALDSLQEIDANVSREQSSANSIGRTLSDLARDIDSRIAGERRLLSASPSLEVLYPLKLAWESLAIRLSQSSRALTPQAKGLEEQLERLDKLNKTWQATLELAKQPETPPPVFQGVQRVVGSIERTRQATESGQVHVLALQSGFSEQEARVQTALSSIEEGENQALRRLFVRDSAPIWNLGTALGNELEKHSGESVTSQLKTSAAFIKRLPSTFLLHAFLIVLIAGALHWLRSRIGKLAQEKPDLQRVLPILDLPVSTAFALSMLLMPAIYAEAPRLVLAIMGTVTVIPAVVILRRLLLRNSYPILNALAIMYLVSLLRLFGASLPVLARFILLGQMLGATVFLVWTLRRWQLPTEVVETHGRIWRTTRTIAKIGIVLLPVAFIANTFGYVNLGNLLGTIFFRSVYIAAILYTAIRIIEGLAIIALQVRPIGSLRAIIHYRPMIQRRTRRALEFLAFLLWLNLLLSFFGLWDPLVASIGAALSANLAVGAFNISLGHILAFLIALWASFLVSKFLRFVLEEDVYHHLHLARGLPYAISTMLHYVILLSGFFVALGALGIDLTKVTILAGAFSVGVGFGLQNVINNFVSGLILLFERPIKVGDVIEVGGSTGEVSSIGIRATIIRTADGSEIIVPNGSLISSQVTNWTLSDRKRTVEVSVNVAGDADPQRVIELLKSTAASHPGVASQPSPEAYIVTFTASAVTFQLQAWINRYEDSARLRTDLSIALKNALGREKIAIV